MYLLITSFILSKKKKKKKNSGIYNYADDNILSFHSPNFNEIINVLDRASIILIDWFSFNCMQANPNKFQAIAINLRFLILAL